MGWSGGDEIVEPVIKQLALSVQTGSLKEGEASSVLEVLIHACQNANWDCEEETLDRYPHLPWVVEAFRQCEVYLPCQATGVLESYRYKFDIAPTAVRVRCSLPLGHTVDHFDELENLEWPK